MAYSAVVTESESVPAVHWQTAYESGDQSKSWFQSEAAMSLQLIGEFTHDVAASVIDIGGGASTLVDGLLRLGFSDITVLDVASNSLDIAAARLGTQARDVEWICANLLQWHPDRQFDLWHDRAVLHFLTNDADQHTYLQLLNRSVRPGGGAVIGVFSVDGPQSCSGLPVRQYDEQTLVNFLGDAWEVLDLTRELHTTPTGAVQEFLWLVAGKL